MRKLFHPKTSGLLKIIFPMLVWERHKASNSIFITFDDGPIPGVTDKALDLLKSYGAKGTFFCKGINVQKYPELFQRVLDEGHDVGNHTFNHLKGWSTKNQVYFEDIENANKLIGSTLFRPPYGKITYPQISHLRKSYDIIMWDVMSFDYDQTIGPEECAKNVTSNVEPGSIITFHDSISAAKNMLYALEALLEYSKDKFVTSSKLSEEISKMSKVGS
jgi:peptidoglycan/xylan/chitin deacetylase (PgdA/CDA1 family)